MKQIKSAISVFTLLAAAVLLAACSPTAWAGNNATPAADDSVQLSEDVQIYIDLSRADLAEQLDISSDQIELESVTDSTSEIDPVIVKLAANGRIFEYHGRDEEVLQISNSSPGQLTFAPALVDSVEVQIDETAPAPVSVIVRGNLPDNCTEIGEGLAVLQDDQTFVVSVTTQRPDGEACGEVLVPYETAVSLGVEVANLPAGDYTIIVNDQVTETFTWQPSEADAGAESGLPQVSVTLNEGGAADVTTYNRPAVEENENMPEWALRPDDGRPPQLIARVEGLLMLGGNNDKAIEGQVFCQPAIGRRAHGKARGEDHQRIRTLRQVKGRILGGPAGGGFSSPESKSHCETSAT